MIKINQKIVIEEYNSKESLVQYSEAIKKVGLWQSEKLLFNKYVSKSAKILDIGCGAGRSTFGLYDIGYTNIKGIDIAEKLISFARKYSKSLNYNIDFIQGDVTKLPYDDNSFNVCFFSFNGIMTIPNKKNRIKAMQEVYRVLMPRGIFIFTTHDYDDIINKEFSDFWEEEKNRWQRCQQDSRLYEFGDLIIWENNKETFLHIPSKHEVLDSLGQVGFKIIETIMRGDLAVENKNIKEVAGECRFWVAVKPLV